MLLATARTGVPMSCGAIEGCLGGNRPPRYVMIILTQVATY
jgi:hypothetical protein